MQKNQTFDMDRVYTEKTCKRLKAFREDTGLTASAVADHLKIPTDLYVLYEKYELVPHQSIAPLCELLKFSPWYYLTGMSDELSPPIRSGR